MDNEKKQGLTTEEEVGVFVSKSERYIENNKKTIGLLLLVLLVVVGGFVAYKYLYAKPREIKASEAMFRAEHYFTADSFNIALYGDSANTKGFLDIIKEYGSTKAGNLAQAYAGISFFKLGDTTKALEHLKKYNGNDQMVSPAIDGLIGDCYADMDQLDEALKYFEKAAKNADNEILSPIYLKKAGLAYEAKGDTAAAIASYQKIKDKYLNSQEAATIDKYIQRIRLK